MTVSVSINFRCFFPYNESEWRLLSSFFGERNHAVLKGGEGELMRTVFILGVNYSARVSQCLYYCFGLLNIVHREIVV